MNKEQEAKEEQVKQVEREESAVVLVRHIWVAEELVGVRAHRIVEVVVVEVLHICENNASVVHGNLRSSILLV